MDFEMDMGSSSKDASLTTAPQTVSKVIVTPYCKLSKNVVLNDPTLEGLMGSKEKALDIRH